MTSLTQKMENFSRQYNNLSLEINKIEEEMRLNSIKIIEDFKKMLEYLSINPLDKIMPNNFEIVVAQFQKDYEIYNSELTRKKEAEIASYESNDIFEIEILDYIENNEVYNSPITQSEINQRELLLDKYLDGKSFLEKNRDETLITFNNFCSNLEQIDSEIKEEFFKGQEEVLCLESRNRGINYGRGKKHMVELNPTQFLLNIVKKQQEEITRLECNN